MAKGNVKKGFATYLVILLTAIIAAFFIIVTVMFFSPFKGILGFKYFMYNDEVNVQEIQYDNHTIKYDFYYIDKVTIDCNYANVFIERNNIDAGVVTIENRCSGFSREDQNTDFTYDITFADNSYKEINIKVREPEGFLFFKKDINITINVSRARAQSLENTIIDINNTNGDVYVGKNVLSQEDLAHNPELSIKELNVKTVKGDLVILNYNKKIDRLFVKTTKGSVDIRGSVKIGELDLHASQADIEMTAVDVDTAVLDLDNSDFETKYIKANSVDLSINNGHLDVESFQGAITSNKMIYDMGKAEINIGKVDGYVSIPNANKAKIWIGEVTSKSQVYLRGYSTNINVDKLSGMAFVETTSGDVNVKTSQDTSTKPIVNIKTGSGKVELEYNREALPQWGIVLETDNGYIDVKANSGLKCTLEVYWTSGEARDSVDVYVSGYDSDFTLPLKISGGGEVFKVVSNKTVSLGWL